MWIVLIEYGQSNPSKFILPWIFPAIAIFGLFFLLFERTMSLLRIQNWTSETGSFFKCITTIWDFWVIKLSAKKWSHWLNSWNRKFQLMQFHKIENCFNIRRKCHQKYLHYQYLYRVFIHMNVQIFSPIPWCRKLVKYIFSFSCYNVTLMGLIFVCVPE